MKSGRALSIIINNMAPIPITILTGFLGSGKTTLLNHIIRNSRGRNIAIVENEFGSVGIDSDLIEKTDQEIVEINDGCICCVVRKDFFSAIERLLDSNKKLDHIIIEASGLSDPIPVAQSFLMQDMDGRVVLDSIICLVDAPMFFNRQTQDLKILTDQLEFADFIVLNKMDQVEKSSLNQITDMIRRVNIYAPIISTTHGEIDMRYIFNTERFSVTSELSDALASR
jgi:G3E family GTPase